MIRGMLCYIYNITHIYRCIGYSVHYNIVDDRGDVMLYIYQYTYKNTHIYIGVSGTLYTTTLWRAGWRGCLVIVIGVLNILQMTTTTLEVRGVKFGNIFSRVDNICIIYYEDKFSISNLYRLFN